MNNENKEVVKSVSAGSIILWILGILTIIMGLAGGYIAVILAGVILLPIVNTLSKKYLKINFSGMARFIIAIIIIIFGSIASSSLSEVQQKTTDQSATSTQPLAQEEVWSEVTTFKGKGNQDTQSFNITGSKARITATTTGGSSIGTYSGISLEKENGGYTGPGLSISTEGYEKGIGQTTYRNIKAGSYYVKVISGVNWEVKVEQMN